MSADRQTDRKIDRLTDRLTGRETYRQTDRQTDRQTVSTLSLGGEKIHILVFKAILLIVMLHYFAGYSLL